MSSRGDLRDRVRLRVGLDRDEAGWVIVTVDGLRTETVRARE